MLIPNIFELIESYGKDKVFGVLHVGAHTAEELSLYREKGISDDNIWWVDAQADLCESMRNAGVKHVIEAAVSDVDGNIVEFHVTNNKASSSLLSPKTHLQEHPNVHFTHTVNVTTRRLENIIDENFVKANFLNLDIQGAELLALKGLGEKLQEFSYLYLEVNEKELYSGCALLTELDSWLKNRGFNRVITRMTQHGWGDALYTRFWGAEILTTYEKPVHGCAVV